ncbi:DUF1494 domain-containing protein [Rhabdochlamydiaceae symbiont of Dictyostelium giganteum]|uniref:DUF1494 domain-containing protein n=1 Tax=Rhabdochlamydiaceae symbiont of Dictyostelium giganteum TaxID=3342349 RepID=UPI00384BB31B
MKQRRSFLLLELLIAFSLMAVVIQMLLRGYQEFMTIKHELKEERASLLDRQCLSLKLKNILNSLTSCTLTDQGLCLIFDHQMDADPLFRGTLKALLYAENHHVILLSWKDPSVYRKDILYYHPDFSSLECCFFDQNLGEFTKTPPLDVPLMMKLRLHHQTHSWELPFFL